MKRYTWCTIGMLLLTGLARAADDQTASTLPLKHFYINCKVPAQAPYQFAPFSDFVRDNVQLAGLTVAEKGEPLMRVEDEGSLGPGRFLVTRFGIIKLDAAERNKTLKVAFAYQPRRIVVSADAVACPVVVARLKTWGDEPVFGAEAEAYVRELQRGKLALDQMASELKCSQMMTVAAQYDMQETSLLGGRNTGWTITASVDIQLRDLTTGDTLVQVSGARQGYCGFLRGPLHKKADLVGGLLSDLIGL